MRKDARIKPPGTAPFKGQVGRTGWQMNLSKTSGRTKRKAGTMQSWFLRENGALRIEWSVVSSATEKQSERNEL